MYVNWSVYVLDCTSRIANTMQRDLENGKDIPFSPFFQRNRNFFDGGEKNNIQSGIFLTIGGKKRVAAKKYRLIFLLSSIGNVFTVTKPNNRLYFRMVNVDS